MYTLYYAPGAASFVVHWLLIDLDLPHQLHPLDVEAREHKQPAYLALNPGGVIPTLLIDGTPVLEAAAIVMHLADVNPGAGLAPSPGSIQRAAYYQWTLYLADTLQPTFRRWFYPGEPAGEANAAAAKAIARQEIESCWQRIDEHLQASGPYLLGDRPCAADFLMTMMMRWSRNMPRPADEWTHLHAHAQRMKARPSFARVYAVEQLTDWT